ncbi:hypothetical protein Peur_072765 [Populus x canadensis]
MQRCSFRVGVLVVCGELEFTYSQFLLLLYILDNNQELVYICLSSGVKGVMILMGSSKTIVWFRRDFRIEYNPALAAAAARDGFVFPVFICWFFFVFYSILSTINPYWCIYILILELRDT